MVIKQKKSMTSFDVAAVVKEIESLVGTRLYNIYDAPGGVLFRFKSSRADYRLVAIPSSRVHLTKYEVKARKYPSSFIMGIRKYLRNTKLTKVYQHKFDRIVAMEFSASGDTMYKIIVELLPRGVLVLLGDANKILQTSEAREMKDRVVKRGLEYSFPPYSGIEPSLVLRDTIEDILRGAEGKQIARTLSRGLGYPSEAVEEVLGRLGYKPTEKITRNITELSEKIAEKFKEIYSESKLAHGYIVKNEESYITVTPFRPIGLVEIYNYSVDSYESFSEALDEYFSKTTRYNLQQLEEAEEERQKLLVSIEKSARSLEELENKARELEEHAMLMSQYISKLQSIYDCAVSARKERGWESVVGECSDVVSIDPRRGVFRVRVNDNIFELDIRIPPDKQIIEIYRRAGEYHSKVERGRKALEELKKKLREVEVKLEKEKIKFTIPPRRVEWYEKYHWIITSSGILAIGGRNVEQNESIVKKYLTNSRIFMHADIHGAPVFVVFTEGREVGEDDLREVAVLAACYSRAWREKIGSVDVYWVWGKQVSKSPPPGEYLARGAFMVYGKRNYIRNIELVLAIGVSLRDRSPIIIVGPEDFVKHRSLSYALIVPGDEDATKVAKKLKKALAKKAGSSNEVYIDAIPIEELVKRIPGPSRIVKVGKGGFSEGA